MTMVAGVFETVLSRLLPRLRRVFPTLICGFIVAAVGLELGLEYRGDLLTLPAHRSVSEDHLIEERPFVKGLAGFLVGVYPDRVRSSTDDGLCRVGLTFERSSSTSESGR